MTREENSKKFIEIYEKHTKESISPLASRIALLNEVQSLLPDDEISLENIDNFFNLEIISEEQKAILSDLITGEIS